MRTLGTALAVALGEPRLWLLATAGFLARGGIVLFLAPLVALPTPVSLTSFFGTDSVTVAGPSLRLVAVIMAALLVLVMAVVGGSLVGAWADAEAHRLVCADPEAAAATGRPAADPGPPGPGRLLGLAGLQVTALLPAALLLAASVGEIVTVGRNEFLLPSETAVPFLFRVVAGAAGPLGRVLVVAALGELLASLATRQYLAAPGATGERRVSAVAAYRRALALLFSRPVRTIVAWAVGSSVLVGAVAGALVAVAVGWEQVRAVLLDPDLGVVSLVSADPAELAIRIGAIAQAASVCLLFVALWLAAIGLAGLASGFRASLISLVVPGGHRASYDGADGSQS